MATTTLTVSLRLAWWVGPYLFAMKAFLWTVVPYLDVDDDRLGAFMVRHAEFICRHGLRCYCNGKRL